MKKRIITLLAVLALLVTCAVFAAPTAEAATDKAAFEADYGMCPCGCGQNIADIQWNTGGTLYNTVAAGHYKKTINFGPGTGATISSTVVIYLDGSAATNRIIWGKTDAGSGNGLRTFNITSTGKLYIIGNNATVTGRAVTTASGGSEQNGGIAYVANGGELHLSGDLLVQVNSNTTQTPKNGGVIFNAGTTTLKDNVVLNSYAKTVTHGKGIYNSGTLNIQDNVQINGAAATSNNGGAIYTTGANARVEMSGGTITASADFAGSQGAAVAVYGGATFNMTGGTIVSNTTASKSGIRVQAANFYMQGGEVKAKLANQNAFSVVGYNGDAKLVLAGNAKVSDPDGNMPESTANVYLTNADSSSVAHLQVANDWTGYANINHDKSSNKTYGKVYGSGGLVACGAWDAETETFTAGGGHRGEIIVGAIDSDPRLYGTDGLMMVMRCILIGKKDGEDVEKWFITPATAFSNIDDLGWDNAFVRLACSYDTSVPAGVDAVLDLNGLDTEITSIGNNSTLSIWDMDASVAEPSGADVTGTGYESYYVRPNGNVYVMNGGKCYRVNVKVTNVSLRPGTEEASMYYTAQVEANAGAGITAWGVAITLTENATALADHMYTRETEVNAENEYNGVLVKGIAKNGANDNAARAAQDIYAKAYIELADGTVVMSDTVSKSLEDVIAGVLALDQSGLTAVQVAAITAMQSAGWYTSIYNA